MVQKNIVFARATPLPTSRPSGYQRPLLPPQPPIADMSNPDAYRKKKQIEMENCSVRKTSNKSGIQIYKGHIVSIPKCSVPE